MEARAKLLGHPVHQMLVVFPLGLLATGVIFDLVHIGTDNEMIPATGAYVCSFVGAFMALFTAR
jgi:uncharacterized membrane protein